MLSGWVIKRILELRNLGMRVTLTRALTKPAIAKTRTVSKWMSKFLLVGRMEKKKLESARQDKFETMTDVVQSTPLNIILEFWKSLTTLLEIFLEF